MQNPQAIKVKEEITRLSKRLKTGERELTDVRQRQAEQKKKVAKLHSDLGDIQAGNNKLTACATLPHDAGDPAGMGLEQNPIATTM